MNRCRPIFSSGSNKISGHLILIALVAILLLSCGTEADKVETGQNPVQDEAQPLITTQPVAQDALLTLITVTVDATKQDMWAYFSLKEGKVVEVANPADSKGWDLGFQRTKIKINGGVSGPGGSGVTMLLDTKFDLVNEAPIAEYEVDTQNSLAIVPQSKKGWYVYTGAPTHWVLSIEDRVFVIKTGNGAFAKIQFLGYYKDNENKTDPAYVKFKYIFQTDGSRNF